MSSKGNQSPRRAFAPEFKAKLVIQLLTQEKSVAELSREHGIRDSLLHHWRQEFVERSARVFSPEASAEDERRLANLERLAGQQSMEIAILKRALEK